MSTTKFYWGQLPQSAFHTVDIKRDCGFPRGASGAFFRAATLDRRLDRDSDILDHHGPRFCGRNEPEETIGRLNHLVPRGDMSSRVSIVSPDKAKPLVAIGVLLAENQTRLNFRVSGKWKAASLDKKTSHGATGRLGTSMDKQEVTVTEDTLVFELGSKATSKSSENRAATYEMITPKIYTIFYVHYIHRGAHGKF
jgi:hypothetical protein